MNNIVQKIICLLLLLLMGQSIFAHGYWVETKGNGKIGQLHDIKVYFSEPNGAPEPTDGEEWALVKGFTLYVISPSGVKTSLTTTVNPDHYASSFIPEEEGGYFVILESTDLGVMEPGKKFAFIPIFYATTLVKVGEVDARAELNNVLDYVPMGVYAQIKKGRGGESLSYIFKNKDDVDFMVTVITPDGQSLQMDGSPKSLDLSKFEKGTYTTQMMIAEKTKGKKDDIEYNTIYRIATSCFIVE